MKLSTDRARAVVTYLKAKGVKEEQLTFKGFGNTKPIASNESAEGRAMNRRVEFEILSQ
jgi:outer membrane protein OmpA-like peptidoglycan-associated protein